MTTDYNTIYLVLKKEGQGWANIAQSQFRKDAEDIARNEAVSSGKVHVVFVSLCYFERDPMTATKIDYDQETREVSA